MRDVLAGVILGTVVGDALGLPRENLSARRASALFGDPPLSHAFLFGWGMYSDDTEHTLMVAQALLSDRTNAERFGNRLACRLRGWILMLPAGVGFATLRACVKLWFGFSHKGSGVWSAGNGPAMRSAILGVCLGQDPQQLRDFVHVCTRITHTDPRAERGALLVAKAAHIGANNGPTFDAGSYFTWAKELAQEDDELRRILQLMENHLRENRSIGEMAESLKLRHGVSGYIYHTVPIALYSWLRHRDDFREAVEKVVSLGGDTDSTGAITGALMGATLGSEAIPPEWLRLAEWPCDLKWIQKLANRLRLSLHNGSRCEKSGPVGVFWPGVIVRNLFFLGVVFGHLMRRLFPPYGFRSSR